MFGRGKKHAKEAPQTAEEPAIEETSVIEIQDESHGANAALSNEEEGAVAEEEEGDDDERSLVDSLLICQTDEEDDEDELNVYDIEDYSEEEDEGSAGEEGSLLGAFMSTSPKQTKQAGGGATDTSLAARSNSSRNRTNKADINGEGHGGGGDDDDSEEADDSEDENENEEDRQAREEREMKKRQPPPEQPTRTEAQIKREKAIQKKQKLMKALKRKEERALIGQLAMMKNATATAQKAAAARQYMGIGAPIPTDVSATQADGLGGQGDDGASVASGFGGGGGGGSVASSRVSGMSTVQSGCGGGCGGGGGGDLFSVMSGQSTHDASKGSTTRHTVPTMDLLVDRPSRGQECFICKVRQPGCPLCWDFPKWQRRKTAKKSSSRPTTSNTAAGAGAAGGGMAGGGGGDVVAMDKKAQRKRAEEFVPTPPTLCPGDFAFAPGDYVEGAAPQEAASGGSGGGFFGRHWKRPSLHTNLTTQTAIMYYRGIFAKYTQYNIKTVPAGNIVNVILENDSTVDMLYEKFRSNSADGCLPAVHLYLPTDNGIFSLCNQDEQETELLRANINAFESLNTYNIGNGSSFVDSAGENRSGKKTAALGGRQRGGGGLPSKDDIVGSTQDPRGRNWSTVSILYYPWYSDIEVSDAWTRRGKPAMETMSFYINGMFDYRSEKLPIAEVFYTNKGPRSKLPITTSIPGPDRVQQRLKPLLEAEEALRQNVKEWEQAEDAAHYKDVIKEVEQVKQGKAMLLGRIDHIEGQIEDCEEEARVLNGELDDLRFTYEDLDSQLHEVQKEMASIDRIVLSSQKSKILKPSEHKMVKARIVQFNELDVTRLKLGTKQRAVAKSAVASQEKISATLARKKSWEVKLAKVHGTSHAANVKKLSEKPGAVGRAASAAGKNSKGAGGAGGGAGDSTKRRIQVPAAR